MARHQVGRSEGQAFDCKFWSDRLIQHPGEWGSEYDSQHFRKQFHCVFEDFDEYIIN